MTTASGDGVPAGMRRARSLSRIFALSFSVLRAGLRLRVVSPVFCFVVAVGRVRAGLRLCAVSPLMLVYTLVN